MNFSSRFFEDAVNEFAKLPGIGRKTALRFVLHLLKQDKKEVLKFSDTINKLKTDLIYCSKCHNISDKPICDICINPSRDHKLICVVEDIRDVIAIENTGQYKGVYHILNGVISPMDGVGPDDLNTGTLIERVLQENVKEVVMALSTTIEGDTTMFYLYKKLQPLGIMVSVIARGVSVGDELEYADEVTLGRSIKNRISYEKQISST